MESIPKDPILEFPPNTLQAIRKMYNLDKPGEMDGAIDILNEWVKKQNHFIRKDYSREYLERIIITAKGSVERAKSKIDKTCTLRTLMPKFYIDHNTKDDLKSLLGPMPSVPLPQFADGYYRVYFTKMIANLDAAAMLNLYRYIVIVWEYMKAHDYSSGVLIISDFRDVNILEFLKRININDLRQACTLVVEGFGLRVKGIYLLTSSKTIDALVSIFKQVLPAKIGERINVLTSEEAILDILNKDIVPKDYGGNERSLATIQDKWFDVLSTKEHVEYMKQIREAVTDEACRQVDEFNDQYMGMPGTFRTLRVD